MWWSCCKSTIKRKLNSIDKTIIFPSLKYCTDNADMIAFLGEKKIKNNSAKLASIFLLILEVWLFSNEK